jgi:preprotein translocase subunit SecD
MNRAVSLTVLLLGVAASSACQQMPAQQAATPAAAQAATQAAPAAARQAPPQRDAQQPSVEFRLAQPERAPDLSELRMANATLWVVPQPLFTRADLSTITSVRANDGKPYVRFTFTEPGARKLALATQRFPGKILVLTVAGNLVATPRIGGPMNGGVLFVPMASEQQALNVAAVIGGEGSVVRPATPVR